MNMVSQWFRKHLADSQLMLLVLVIVGTLVLISLFGHMLAPAIAAVVLAFLLDGPVCWLKSKGVRPIFSISFVFISFMLLMLILLLAVIPPLFVQVGQFLKDSPAMVKAMQDAILSLQVSFPDILTEEQVHDWFGQLGKEFGNLGPQLVQYSLSGFTGAVSFVVYLVLVPVMVFFFLKDKEQLLGWIGSFFPTDKPLLEQVWHEVIERAGDYARGKVYEIIIVAVAAFITYQLLDLRYATLLAVATGLSVVVPYFGAAVVTLPVALVAFFQWGVSGEMLGAVVAYLILQAFDGNLLAPLLFSEVVKLHPNAIIMAILIFGGIWGLWGVFFAIPLATVANAVMRAWREHSATLSTI